MIGPHSPSSQVAMARSRAFRSPICQISVLPTTQQLWQPVRECSECVQRRYHSSRTLQQGRARRALRIDAVTNLASSAFTSRYRIIAYWVTTALVVFELALGGVWDILRVPQVRGLIERLGYPQYFLIILGIWKLLGAVALVIPRFPRLKEWAYAGVFFDLTGAVASLLVSGLVDAGTLAYPIIMTGVAVASWALRPPSRRLGPG